MDGNAPLNGVGSPKPYTNTSRQTEDRRQNCSEPRLPGPREGEDKREDSRTCENRRKVVYPRYVCTAIVEHKSESGDENSMEDDTEMADVDHLFICSLGINIGTVNVERDDTADSNHR
jgi:hypothetical protein